MLIYGLAFVGAIILDKVNLTYLFSEILIKIEQLSLFLKKFTKELKKYNYFKIFIFTIKSKIKVF